MEEPAVTAKVTSFFTAYPRREFREPYTIVQAGQSPAGVYYLAEGSVQQYDIAPTGAHVVVNTFKPGAFFPMSWAINATPNNYFFEAAAKTVVHIVPPQEAIAFIKDNPDVLYDLLARVYRGTDGVLRRMAHLMGGSARSRLLFELVTAGYRFGKLRGSGVCIALNEGDLAKQTGLARETVNRMMQGLKAEGLVQLTRDGIVLPSLQQLEAVLGADL